jgi:AcrR family transcriptional regulator
MGPDDHTQTEDQNSAPETSRAGRGRPRRFEPPKSLRHLPIGQPLEDLSPTVRAMLDAGRRILVERGFHALTLESVAFEAGASKSTLVEHFGDRTGFLAILFDSLMQDESLQLGSEMRRLRADHAGAEEYIRSLAMLYEDVDAGRAYFEIAANAMHEKDLRLRLADLFEWYRELRLKALGKFEGAEACTEQELEELAALLDAAEDGLTLRRSLDPRGFDLAPVLALLGSLVAAYLREKARGYDASSDGRS